MYLTGEGRAFSKAFDVMMQNAGELLADPAVVNALGDSTPVLRAIHKAAFLHLRSGKLSLPRARRGDDHLAVVPITDEQAKNADQFIEPLFDSWVGTAPTDKTYSSFYKLNVAAEVDELIAMFGEESTGEPEPFVLPKGAGAMTAFSLAGDETSIHFARPVVMIRAEHAARPRHVGGILVHELVHVEDAERDGPALYSVPSYKAATELRAYHIGAVIGGDKLTTTIEAARQQKADPAHPFRPTPELIAFLRHHHAI